MFASVKRFFRRAEPPAEPEAEPNLPVLRTLLLPGLYKAFGSYSWRYLVDDCDIIVPADRMGLLLVSRWKDHRKIESFIYKGRFCDGTYVGAFRRSLNEILPTAVFGDEETVVEYDTPGCETR